MKRFFIMIVMVLSFSFLFVSLTYAQDATSNSIEVGSLFSWVSISPPDWGRGALLAFGGLVGALFTMLTLVGGTIPGTVGKADLDIQKARLDKLYTRLEELCKASDIDADDLKQLTNTIHLERRAFDSERWRQWTIGALLYLILGSFFAAMLSQDILQALIIGAGWTGYVGNFGLKHDFAKRASEKDKAIDQLEEVVKGLETRPEYTEIIKQAQVAKLL